MPVALGHGSYDSEQRVNLTATVDFEEVHPQASRQQNSVEDQVNPMRDNVSIMILAVSTVL
jgi:hypothetical protein